jgi:hypothetical protein
MKRILTLSHLRLLLEILLIAVLALAAFSNSIHTQAASTQAPEAPQALYWYSCDPPNHVGLFFERIHIFCQTTTPIAGAPPLSASITWFAVPTTPDSVAASRFMSLLQTSTITGRVIWINLDPADTSGSSFGCGAANCRRLYGMEMR